MYVHKILSFIELSLPGNPNQGLGVPCSQPWGQPATEAHAEAEAKKVTIAFLLSELLIAKSALFLTK